jgi:hypothetical protein
VIGSNTLAQYAEYSNLPAGEVIDSLNALAPELAAIGNSGVLAMKIPIIGKSLSQVIDLGQVFRDSFGPPLANNPNGGSAQDLINYLLPRVKPGTPVTSRVLPDAIEFTFTFEKNYTKTLPVALDLDSLGGLITPARTPDCSRASSRSVLPVPPRCRRRTQRLPRPRAG